MQFTGAFIHVGFPLIPFPSSHLFFPNHILVRLSPAGGPEEGVDSRVPPRTHRVSPAALTKELFQELFLLFFSEYSTPIQNSFGISNQRREAPNAPDHFQTASVLSFAI